MFFFHSSLYNIYDRAGATTLNLVGIIDFRAINDFKKDVNYVNPHFSTKSGTLPFLIENLFSAKVGWDKSQPSLCVPSGLYDQCDSLQRCAF